MKHFKPNFMNINEKLVDLYTENLKGIQLINEPSFPTDPEHDFDGPLLMHCWEDEYESAAYKILFIGQETNGWVGWASDNINQPLETYKKFALGENYRGPFWDTVKSINSILNPNSGEKCFLWTNVSKYSDTDGKPISFDDHKRIIKEMNLLPKEIEIVKPDVIIFFSGPNYDEKIQFQFEGDIEFEQLQDDIPKRELAHLSHSLFASIKVFRTYHPSALQRQNKLNYLDLILKNILE